MQRIYINEDDKLVIETDNGQLVGNETSTKIEGVFEVDGLDVMKIKHLIDGSEFKTCVISTRDENGYYSSKYFGYIVDKKEGDVFKKELNTKINELIEEKRKLSKEFNDKLTSIFNKIKEHNSHWYNRKIKI